MLSKTRPLWGLSDFVVEQLPALLATDPSSLPATAMVVLQQLSSDQLEEAYNCDRELALLDLKMIELGIIGTSNRSMPSPVPASLSSLVDEFAKGYNIGGLQYHELVEINPINDMRAFTTGVTREWEISFYNAHRSVEHRLKKIVDACESFLLNPSSQSPLLERFESLFDFKPIEAVFHQLTRRMPPEEFGKFRNYLMKPNPYRDLEGPSGAYTWRVPYIEFMVWGQTIPQSYLHEVRDNVRYFSWEGKKSMLDRISRITELSSLTTHVPTMPLMVKLVWDEMHFMESFRNMHHGAVARQLPKVLSGSQEGTGTVNTRQFLEGRRHSMLDIYQSFKIAHPLPLA